MTDVHQGETGRREGRRDCGGLRDHRCVVTGASSGIGHAIALELAAAGATVFGVARREAPVRAIAEVVTGPGQIAALRADLSVEADIFSLAERVGGNASGIDVLVHSAGAYARGPVQTSSADDFDRQYITNVRAPYLLTQALLAPLRTNRGQIVFINSTVVFAASPDVGQFAATQHALRAFVDTLREEVNADGIRVASIYPGRTATPRQARIHALEGKTYVPERMLQPGDVADVVLKILTLPRSAEVTDVRIRPMLKH
jgi:NADP-dependent 3-hydroxy acid dehydrogenase YdfG